MKIELKNLGIRTELRINENCYFFIDHVCPFFFIMDDSLVGWGCIIHRLHLSRGVTPPPTNVLDWTLNCILWRGSSSEASGNVDYSFIGIPLRANLNPKW